MAVELFDSINRSKVDKLPFLKTSSGGGAYPFGYKDIHNKGRLGIVYEVTAENKEKIKKLLSGKEDRQIQAKDRVFVLSGCKIPQFKIKEYLRGIGAVMVNEIEEATVFVGNNVISQNYGSSHYAYLNSTSMIIGTNYFTADTLDHTDYELDPVLNDYYPDLEELGSVRLNKAAASAHKGQIGRERFMDCITPYVARVVYEILSRKIITINEDCLFKQLPGVVSLDKELTQSLMSMMESDDEETQKTAHEILANCDWKGKEAELYLYTIARGHYGQISRSRFKNVKLFLAESKLRDYWNTEEEVYLRKKADNDKLTVEMLDLILPLVAKKVESRVDHINSSVFTIKMELKPEFANLLGEHQFNKTVQPDKNTIKDEF